jgi:hypothetical protein
MMKVEEQLGTRGRVRWYSRPASDLPPEQGVWTPEGEVSNLVVTAGKVHLARMHMDDPAFKTGLKFIEVGEGTTAAALGDTALETPTSRRPVIDAPIRTANVVAYRAFYPASLVSVDIEESGIFGHSTATATIGTGEMFARALVTFANAADPKDLTLEWEITYG